MKAIVLSNDLTSPATAWSEWPDPVAKPGWVVVEIKAASLNRNDAMTIDDRGAMKTSAVIGSDGVGVVCSLGEGVETCEVGDEVVILPSLFWGDNEAFTHEDFEILGGPTQGALAQFITVPAANVFTKPGRLSWQETAALPLAGVTAWRALVTQGGLVAGQRVLLTGASGGVASFAIMITKAIGAEVFVTTSSQAKLDAATELGASGGVLREDSWELALAEHGPFDLILDSSGKDWSILIGTLRPGGTLVSIGRTVQNIAEVVVRDLFVGQHRLLGSSMGSPSDFAALLEHVENTTWVPAIDAVLKMSDCAEAFDRLNSAGRYGKIVLEP